jgi:hypothetical protein
LVLALLILFQPAALAQSASGSISGTVADSTGAVVPGATVVLMNEATTVKRETVSNSAGFFSFPAVQPATYTVTITSPGFTAWERKSIAMTQGASLTIPSIVLQIQATRQELQVVSAAEVVVPIDSGQASQTLNRNMVEELSIVGRDAAELIKIMPGMAMATGLGQNMWNSYTTASNTGPIGSFAAAGTQPNGAMTMTSDGANLLDPGNQGTQTANINQNQVQEVSILTSAYGAEFAKGPVTFQAIGKSGGAQFHGSGYLYARNGTFNAVDSYSKSQGGKPLDDKFYYPGGDLGGPVIIPGTGFNKNRDKLFFYAAYEYMKQQPAGNLHTYFVPTDEMKAGNFSPEYINSLGPNFKNAYSSAAVTPGGNATSADGIQFPGGMIPKTLIDPNSLAYMALFPKPNADPTKTATGYNYSYYEGPAQNRWELRLRGDYSISQNTKAFFSWNHQLEHFGSPIGVWWQLPGSLPYPSNQLADQKSDVYSANVVHVFSPTLTNEFIFAKADFLNPIKLANQDAVNPDKVGFKMTGLFKNPYMPQIPNAFSWSNSSIGFGTYPYGANWPPGGPNSFGKLSQTPNISDNVTKVTGTHTLKAGFYWDFARNFQVAGINLDNTTQGAAEFENWGARSTGNPMADLIMGRATQFRQPKDAPGQDFKYYQYSFYVNDAWKTTRRLTLTMGLRFDHMGNWFTASGPGLAVWDPSTYNNTSNAGAWTGMTWNARDKSIPMSGFPSRPLFYEPRFGFAYDMFGDGRTVVRGGAGLYRYQLAVNSVSGDAYNASANIPSLTTTWGCCVGWNNFSDYSPSLGAAGLGSGPNGVLTKGDDRTPYTWTYNFTISQRAPWHSVVELQYSGNRSEDMMLHGSLSNVNLVPFAAFFGVNPKTGKIEDPAASGFQPNDYRPMSNYTDVTLIGHGSYSRYNSFIASWQKQSGPMTFTANYTFSKVLGIRDNQTDNGQGAGNTLDPYNFKANYGVLGWDHTHIFNSAYVVNLPSPAKSSKVLGGVVNGWVLSGITQLQSGAPIQPNTGGTLNVQWPGGFSNQRYLGTNALTLAPKVICDPRSNLKDGQYFNPSCFAPPTGGKNGDIIWPYIKGPAFFNSDLAVYKNFKVTENQKLQLRFSAFNFLNHPLPQLGRGGNSDIQLNFNNNDTLSQTNLNALTNGKAMFTVGRRVIEFTAKYTF